MNAVRTIATNAAIIPGTIKLLEGSKPLKIIYPPRINPWNTIAAMIPEMKTCKNILLNNLFFAQSTSLEVTSILFKPSFMIRASCLI